jgi:hypothetical protein
MSAGWDGNYGKMVAIGHGGSYATFYGHLASIASGIRAGAYVRQGQLIGTVGATGLATGPHLDYRMKRNGSPVNPLSVVLPSKSGIASEDREAYSRHCGFAIALLEHRCAERSGYYVLDMKPSQPASDSVMNGSLSQAAQERTHGGKSGT